MGLLKWNERASSIAEACVDGERVQVVVHRARGFRRLRGMIASSPMAGPEALMFENCRSVHGCLMGRTLSVVFVDEAGDVTSVRLLRPWRFVADRRASIVLEFEPGTASRLGIRDTTKFIFAEKG